VDKIKILLADDHLLFRDGIKSLLNDVDNIEIIEEVANGKELLEKLKTSSPDIVIADISMPSMSGIEATRIITEEYPDIKVLILSMHNDEEFILNSIKSGAKGYLPKDTGRDELLKAIYSISNEEEYYNKDISDTILKGIIKKTKSESKLLNKIPNLTNREIEIIKLVAEGFINKEIADKLYISIRTVDSHKNNIMQKLKLKSTVDLVKYAIKNNLIEL